VDLVSPGMLVAVVADDPNTKYFMLEVKKSAMCGERVFRKGPKSFPGYITIKLATGTYLF